MVGETKKDARAQPTRPVPVRSDETVQRLMAALEGLRYGSIEIVVHDGKVVQISRTEKTRFESPAQRR